MLGENLNSFLRYVESTNKVEGLLFTWNESTKQLELISKSSRHSHLKIKSWIHTFYVTVLGFQLAFHSFLDPAGDKEEGESKAEDGTLGLITFFTGMQIYHSYVLHVISRLAPDIVTFVNGHLWCFLRFSLGKIYFVC